MAVIVYPQSTLAKQYARIALARLEQVLTDNGVTLLDQKKAEELKKGWKKLEDPGALITAEKFVKSAGKYAIEGVYRVYLDTALGSTRHNLSMENPAIRICWRWSVKMAGWFSGSHVSSGKLNARVR